METGAFPFLASGAGTELKAVRCSLSSKAGTAFENCRQYGRTDVKLRGDFLQRAGGDAAAVFGLDLAQKLNESLLILGYVLTSVIFDCFC